MQEIIYLFDILISEKYYHFRNTIKSILADTCNQSYELLCTEVYDYIFHCYYKCLRNSYKELAEHDMFMLLPIERIVIETRTYRKSVQRAIKLLTEVGLLEKGPYALKKQTTFRITEDAVTQICESSIELDDQIAYELGDHRDKLERTLETLRNNRSKGMIPFDMINSCLNDAETMKMLVPDEEQRNLVYVVSHYYFKYTGQLFDWNLGNFNAILCNWRNRSDRKKSELGMSYAIYEALREKLTKIPIGKRIQTNYSPDVSFSVYTDKETLKNLYYDDILGHFPEFREWLELYKSNKTTDSCPC